MECTNICVCVWGGIIFGALGQPVILKQFSVKNIIKINIKRVEKENHAKQKKN